MPSERAVGYVRVSSAGQVDGHSLDAQERLFKELCKNRGWEAVRIYREEGKSAHNESFHRRPQFKQLLEDAAKGRFDRVVVHTLDRWSRSLQVTLETVAMLAKYNVDLVSISEQLDYSNPQGKLFTSMLGAFAQYYSDALATHVKKGISQRATEGKHLGGIPFGYESCWAEEGGKRVRRCDPEHKAGIHIHPTEGPAVTTLFQKYATGTTTLSQLAAWLNEQGFRTRNTKNLPDGSGGMSTGPRLFTTSSVRGILHNRFYAGEVKHGEHFLPGAHEPLIAEALFNVVQATLKKNSGRSETLMAKPARQYLLKGIIRCAFCGMPLWAETYKNGQAYYREQYGSRSYGDCFARGGSIPCGKPDEQVGRIVQAIVLEGEWLDRVLAKIDVQDEVDRINKRRKQVEDQLKRLGRAYVDGLYTDNDYAYRKQTMQMELEGLAMPEVNAATEAGRLIEDLPELWEEATLEERRKILLTMLDAVYVDMKVSRSIVAIKPKPPFMPILQVATTREGSGIALVKEVRIDADCPVVPVVVGAEGQSNVATVDPEDDWMWYGPPDASSGQEAQRCFWWRRGGVEPPVQKNLPRIYYRLSLPVDLGPPAPGGPVR